MLEKFLYKGEAFMMSTGVFDVFRSSWLECSACRHFLFEKQMMSDIPSVCPYCGWSVS